MKFDQAYFFLMLPPIIYSNGSGIPKVRLNTIVIVKSAPPLFMTNPRITSIIRSAIIVTPNAIIVLAFSALFENGIPAIPKASVSVAIIMENETYK